MDSHLDIYPWPYEWNRDYDGRISQAFAQIDFLFPGLDKWTYHNHWSHFGEHEGAKDKWIVDLYWSTDDEERLQLPLWIGDQVTSLLLQEHAQHILRINWNYAYWRPVIGWEPWTGPQGDFVDHVHIEFKEYLWDAEG